MPKDVTKTKKAKGGQNFSEQSVTLYSKTYKVGSFPTTQQINCSVYGLAVKLVRCTAGMNNDTYSDAERSAKIDECWEHMKGNNWNKPGTGVSTMKKKVDEAASKATPEELAVLKKLGLVT